MARKISQKFIVALKQGRKIPVKFRWGETYEGDTEWTEWEQGILVYEDSTNTKGEEGVNIDDVGGYGYAGRDKKLEKCFGRTIFSRFTDEDNQHHLQVEFVK